MVTENFCEKGSSYGSYKSYASYGPIFFGRALLVTLVTLVTDGVKECLGKKVKLRANFFRRSFVSFGSCGSYASYGWCQIIFVRKG